MKRFSTRLIVSVALVAGCSSPEGGDGPDVATGGSVATGSGGTSGSGGASTSGGSPSSGGNDSSATGGAQETASGGAVSGGADGADGAGGDTGTGGAQGIEGPCDIYEAGGTPCVAAHSTVRALYGSYAGKLYQVRRSSDNTTQDISVVSAGSYADGVAQETFCTGTLCVISIIYDQSPKGNHLTRAPKGGWLDKANGGTEADATKAKITLNGHPVYGVYTTGSFDDLVGGVGYRNNETSGVAVADEPETIYMVASGKHFNQWCCFDYGNAETNNLDNGPATMETAYFGSSTQWGRGSGTGPWVMADLEDGVFAGGSFDAPESNTSLIADYVTVMVKGHSGDRFGLKGGDAQSGLLSTKYDGKRPNGYSPQKKEGAIVLGIGGDNSHTGEGTFFEGCMTAGVASDEVDAAIQANIVAAGYGK